MEPQIRSVAQGNKPPWIKIKKCLLYIQVTCNKNLIIDKLGVNLNNEAYNHKIDKVIGRDKEINELIEILNRRNKCNPLLIGEAGVGKTAIVEGLAYKIINKEAPDNLLNKKVYLLDIASINSLFFNLE